MPMTVKEVIEALSKCHPDAEVLFSIDWQADEGGIVAVEHEVVWRREQGESDHPGRVYLHNNKSHFFIEDGSPAEGNFMRT